MQVFQETEAMAAVGRAVAEQLGLRTPEDVLRFVRLHLTTVERWRQDERRTGVDDEDRTQHESGEA
jgi:hypothetical protein